MGGGEQTRTSLFRIFIFPNKGLKWSVSCEPYQRDRPLVIFRGCILSERQSNSRLCMTRELIWKYWAGFAKVMLTASTYWGPNDQWSSHWGQNGSPYLQIIYVGETCEPKGDSKPLVWARNNGESTTGSCGTPLLTKCDQGISYETFTDKTLPV